MAAVAARDEAAHREICVDVFTEWRAGLARQALLNPFEGFERDQAVMLAFAQPHAPARHLDNTGIERLRQDLIDPLIRDLSALILGEQGLGLEEALHFRLRFEPARRIALQGFANDRRHRFILNQTLAAARRFFISVSPRGLKHPMPVHHAGAHPVLGLLCIFLPLVLRGARQHVLHEQAVGVFAKHDGRGFEQAARRRDVVAQFAERDDIAGETRQIVYNDDERNTAVLSHQGERGAHGWPVCGRACIILTKHFDHFELPIDGIFAAPGFLTAKAVPARRLFRVGHPGVDDAFLGGVACHGSFDP